MFDIFEIIKVISGSVFVLFLPGFAWSFVFFKKDEIDWIERIALSFGLSIALVPLAVFWLNYFLGVKINLLNVTIIILALTGTAVGVYVRKSKYSLKELQYIITHEIPKNQLIMAGSAIFLIIIFVTSSLIFQPQSPQPHPERSFINFTPDAPSQVSSVNNASTTLITHETRKYPIKIDVSHGFNPGEITINISDVIVWNNEENQRTRVVLISKDGLFDNRIMQYTNKYYYQFNSSGTYNFILAEHNTLEEYPYATGNVIVK